MNVSRTAFDSRCMINEVLQYRDLDLEVVSMEGAVTHTSKILLALASHSPCLQALLASDTPCRLLLPDVPTQSVHHLLNVLTQGYTTGPGSGDAVVKGMKEAAKVLGLPKFPVIAFEVEGNGAAWPSDQDVIQWSTERTQAEEDDDIVKVVEIDAENKDDDGVERESSRREIKEQSISLKVLSVGDINKKHVNDSVGDINKKHVNDSGGDINKKHLNDSVGDINKKHLNDSMGDNDKKNLNDSMGGINKKHLNDSVGDINKRHLNDSAGDHQNENQPQRKRRRMQVDPKNEQMPGKVRQSSVQLDQVHQEETNLPPAKNFSHAIPRVCNGELCEKVVVPSLRDKISSNLSSEPDKINSKNRVLSKLKSMKNRPNLSGRQQSGGRFPAKINRPVNLINQKSDDGIESFSPRKSANHVAINSYSSEVLSTTTTSSTQPSLSYSCDAISRIESMNASHHKHKDLGKFKGLSKPKDLSKFQDPNKYKVLSKPKDLGKLKDISKSQETSKPKDPSKFQDLGKSKDPNRRKDPSKVSNRHCDVELVEHMKPHNQEVTEAIPKVLKAEPEEGIHDENQNDEALDTILCGICYKSFSFNAAALAVHAETHGSQFGGNGKGKRKCSQCTEFEGDRTRLLMHMRAKHTKEKLFKCKVCNNSFATCAARNTHEKKH